MRTLKKIFAIMLIITLMMSLVCCNNTDDKLNNEDLEDTLSHNEATEIEVSLTDKNYIIKPVKSDSIGMDTSSGFKITCKESKSINDIERIFSIDPVEEYNLEKINAKEYIINFKKPLAENSLYKVNIEENEGKPLSWVFQTKRSFKIVRTLPRDKGTFVPTNSGIEIEFSYSNIKPIDDYFVIEPNVEGRFEYHKNTAVFVHKGLEPDTVYTVTLKKGIGIKDSDEVTCEDYTFKFKTKQNDFAESKKPNLTFVQTLYNFTSKSVPQLEVFAGSEFNKEELEVEIYKYNNQDYFIETVSKFDNSNFYWYQKTDEKIDIDLSKLQKTASFKTGLIGVDAHRSGGNFISFPDKLDEGYYLINVVSKYDNYQTHIQVNDAAVYIMLGEEESFVWVNDSRTGKPIEGAEVSYDNYKSIIKTNSEGVALIDNQIVSKEDFGQVFITIKMKDRPNYIARIIKSHYAFGNTTYFRDYFGYVTQTDYWEYMYLDRGLYLPNDELKVWGMVKHRIGTDMVSRGKLYLYKSDYGDQKFVIDSKEVNIDDFGTYQTKLSFKDLIPGRYSVEFKLDDKLISKKYINIRRYTKPAYKIKADFDKDRIYAWETAKLNLDACFFEGSPVSGLKINYSYRENDKYITSQVKCDNNGHEVALYEPKVITNKWHPIGISFNISSAKAENVEVRARDYITVFPRDVMVNLNTKAEDDKGIIEVETNKIDIYKEAENNDYSLNNYKGESIDIDLNVKICEVSYTKEEAGEYYDFINKKVKKNYRYKKHENFILDKDVNTKNGYFSMKFPLEEEKNYEVYVYAKDTRGGYIEEKSNLNIYKHDGYYSTKHYYIDESNTDKHSYKLGEKANISLKCNGNDVDETNGDKMLYLVLKDGYKSHLISSDVQNSFTFTEEDIPNYYLRAVYFDGENIFLAGLRNIGYDYTEKELDIFVKADKESYRPGDTVNLDFKVRDKLGNPVQSKINLSIVDEAFFAVEDQSVNTLGSLYDYCFKSRIIADYVSFKEINLYGSCMAEGGDCGDEGYIRSDFKDTAFFETHTTNNNGTGSISFKLPDNLTSWRVTYQALTKDLHGANGKININAKLPFFLNVILSDKYMVGDNPCITVRGFGTKVKENQNISYKVTLKNKNGDVKVLTKESKIGDFTNISLGTLVKGKYSITVEADSNGYFDGIEKEFEVLDSMTKAVRTEFVPLKEKLKLNGGKGYTNVYFYNEPSALYYNNLMSLYYTWGNRVDQKLSRKLSKDLMKKYFEENLKDEEYCLENYQIDDGGIALLPYSSSDTLLSAKVASVAKDMFDMYKLKAYFTDVVENENSTSEDVAAAYWGLAALNEPVLLDIQNLIKDSNLNLKEKTMLAIGLAEIGDTIKAEEIYVDVLNSKGKQSGNFMYIDNGIDKDDILENTSLMSILSLKLDRDEKYAFLRYVKNGRTKDILTNLEQLMFVMEGMPQIDISASFTYKLNGEKHEVQLRKNDRFKLFLNQSELKDIRFRDIKGDIVACVSYIGSIKDLVGSESENMNLNRRYSTTIVREGSFKHSDLIKITITPEFLKSAQYGTYEITDILPAGLRYVSSSGKNISHPIERDGQRLVFSYYYGPKQFRESIIYYARAVTPGTYTVDNAVIKHSISGEMAFTQKQTISIEE